MNDSHPSEYPAWLFFFPMYIMLFTFALLGRSGYVIVADAFGPLPQSEFIIYYILTYCVYFPVIFLSQFLYYRILSRRFEVFWGDFAEIEKVLIIIYDIVGFLLYLWVEHIFGVNAPYITTWDFQIGWMYVWFGDFLFFFIVSPLFMCGFHGINFAVCRQINDPRKYQFFIVVVGTSVLGTITQDWWWWISAPGAPWGPGVTIYFYWPQWIHIPLTPIYIPVVYLIVALVSLGILFVSTIKIYSFKEYLLYCVCPYLLLVCVGNILILF